MNATKKGSSEKKQKLSTNTKISKVISDWVGKNKKVFWKYEVSCFYQTYLISITNLPLPEEKDITISPNNRLLTNQQKLQLCNAVKKGCAGTDISVNSTIDVKVNYVNGGAVITDIVKRR